MITANQKRTWRQYEAGRNYKRQIGLYSRLSENERFYRGDQWRGGGDLPKPVFNVISRIVDYLVSSAAVGDVKIIYSDENLPFAANSAEAARIAEAVDLLLLCLPEPPVFSAPAWSALSATVWWLIPSV